MTTKTTKPGLAAEFIDWGFDYKLSRCEKLDEAFGIKESDPRSSVQFLRLCYLVRRPYFELWDDAYAWLDAWVPTTQKN